MLPAHNTHLPKPPPTGNASTDNRPKRDADSSESKKDGVQGEGNYDAAREFNQAERKFRLSVKL